MLKQFFRDSFIYGLATIVTRGISLFLVPIYTRVLSPGEYGVIDMVAVVASLVNLTVALEISQGVARYFTGAKTMEEKRTYASTSLWFSLAAYGLALLIALPYTGELSELILGDRVYEPILRVALVSVGLNGLFYLLQNQLRWQLSPKSNAVASLVSTSTTFASSILFVVYYRTGVIGVFYGQIIGLGTGCLLSAWFSRSSYGFLFSNTALKEMLSFSIPLVPSSIAVFVALYIDRLAIRHLMTIEDVGLYGIAYRFATILPLLLMGFQGALTPLVYNNYENAETPGELERIFRYFLALLLPALLGLIIFSREILILFTTPSYYAASSVMGVLGAAMLLSRMYIFAPGLAIEKKTGHIAGISVIGAIINTALNYLLIPVFGMMGAAAATLVGAAVSFGLYMIFSQKLYHVPHRWWKISLSGAMVILVAVLMNLIDLGSAHILMALAIKTLILACSCVLIVYTLMGLQEIKQVTGTIARKLNKPDSSN
jgi:O-antigen/teichoic acid export membrane protein